MKGVGNVTKDNSNIAKELTRLSLPEIAELMQDYELEVDGAEEQGEGVWRLVTDRGIRCLHLVRLSEPRLLFINSVMEHLANRGIRNSVRMIKNKYGQAFSFTEAGKGFYLTDWLPGRPCSFTRTDQVQEVARLLATIHTAAENVRYFQGSACLEGWGDWPNKFSFRILKLRDIALEIRDKQHKGKTEKLFLENLEYFLAQAEKALSLLLMADYQELVEQERSLNCFCLRDIGSRNILRHEGALSITGFDYCICDLRVYDLARLLRKFGTSSHWDWSKSLSVLQAYESIRPLSIVEKKVLLALLTFPRKYWLYSKKYFTNDKGEKEGVSDRLKRTVRSEGERIEFLNRLQEYVYNQ